MLAANEALKQRREVAHSQARLVDTQYELAHSLSRVISNHIWQSAQPERILALWNERLNTWKCIHELKPSDANACRECLEDYRDFGDYLLLIDRADAAERIYAEGILLLSLLPSADIADEMRAMFRVRQPLCQRRDFEKQDLEKRLLKWLQNRDLIILLQQRFEQRADVDGVALASEKLLPFQNDFLALRAAAKGFARAAELAQGESKQSYHSRCLEILKMLAQLSNESLQRLKTDALFQPYRSELGVLRD
jgi:hypothetical protein